jgi:hypothetical protein
MSRTFRHEQARAERAGIAKPTAEPTAVPRWGITRHLRARMKVKARRMERHALPDPIAVLEGAPIAEPHAHRHPLAQKRHLTHH